MRLAEDPFDLAQQDAGEIKHVNADVEQDEPFLRRKIRLACIDVVSGPPVDTRPGQVADGSAASTRRTSRIGDWKRKFS